MKATFRYNDIVTYLRGVESDRAEHFAPVLSSVERFRVRDTSGGFQEDVYLGLNIAHLEGENEAAENGVFLRCYRTTPGPASGANCWLDLTCFILEYETSVSNYPSMSRFRSAGPIPSGDIDDIMMTPDFDQTLRNAARDQTDVSLTALLKWRGVTFPHVTDDPTRPVAWSQLKLRFEEDMGGGESFEGGAITYTFFE